MWIRWIRNIEDGKILLHQCGCTGYGKIHKMERVYSFLKSKNDENEKNAYEIKKLDI